MPTITAAVRRRIVTNYIGGIGYYMLTFMALLWLFMLYLKLQSYLIIPAKVVTTDDPAMGVAGPATFNLFATILVYVFAFAMGLLTLAIVVAIPYYIGKVASRLMRTLLVMTHQTQTLAHLLHYKLISCVVMIGIVLVTVYDFRFDAADNWPSFSLIGLSILAMVFFGIQHAAARLWKVSFKNVF